MLCSFGKSGSREIWISENQGSDSGCENAGIYQIPGPRYSKYLLGHSKDWSFHPKEIEVYQVYRDAKI